MTDLDQSESSTAPIKQDIAPALSPVDPQQPVPPASPVDPSKMDSDMESMYAASQKSSAAPSQDKMDSDMDAMLSASKSQPKYPVFHNDIGEGDFLNAINPFNGGPQALTDAQRIYWQSTTAYKAIQAFGKGYEEAEKNVPELSPEDEKYFHDHEMIKNYMNDQDVANKSFLEGSLGPAVNTLMSAYKSFGYKLAENTLRSISDITFAPFAGVPAGIKAAGEEMSESKNPAFALLGGAAQASLEYPDLMVPHFYGVPALPREIAVPKANGILENDGVYMGHEQPTVQQSKDMNAASAMYPQETQIGPKPPIKTVEEVARSLDSDTFGKFDDLNKQLESAREEMQQSRQSRDNNIEAARIDELKDLQDKLEGANPRKAKIYQGRIDAINDEITESKTNESPEMAAAREKVQSINSQLYDLAGTGKIRDAYQRAEASMPKEAPREVPKESDSKKDKEPSESEMSEDDKIREAHKQAFYADESFENRQSRLKNEMQEVSVDEGMNSPLAKALGNAIMSDKPKDQIEAIRWAAAHGRPDIVDHVINKAQKEAAASKSPAAAKQAAQFEKIAQLRGHQRTAPQSIPDTPAIELNPAIIADATKRITLAGRPQEEASLVAQLIAEHYQSRSERFNGKNGTAEEMYQRDSTNFRQGIPKAKKHLQDEGGVVLSQKSNKQKGYIQLATDAANATITLFKGRADASTIIHELGHHWFDELLRDAADDQAPQSLRDDATALKKWAGIGEDDMVTDRAHERIARAFERYLMEGAAPSKRLADVFAKFKDWLTQIYKTVDKLKAPITPEVRNVFDRLLSSKPERTIVKNENAGEALAHVHTEEAKITPPKKAAATADLVRAEIDNTIKQHKPEIIDAVKQGETNGSTREIAGASTIGAEAQTTPRGLGPIQESGEVPTGGSGPTAEGGAVRSEPATGAGKPDATTTRDARSDAKPDEGIINPYKSFKNKDGKEEPPKAGNIRLDKINQPQDIDDILQERASENDDFATSRRIGLTAQQTLDLADALGIDPAFIKGKDMAAAYNAEQIIKAKQLLVASAYDVKKAMSDVKENKGDKSYVLKLAEVVARHDMIQGKVAMATAEWSHAGRALQIVLEGGKEAKDISQFLKDNTGRTLDQLEDLAEFGADLKNPAQMAKFLNDAKKEGFSEAIKFYYINCLLSGPITHARYAVGNALKAVWTPLVQIPIAAATGKVYDIIGANRDEMNSRIYLGEAGKQLYAMGKGSRDGLIAAVESFRTGQLAAVPGSEARESFAGAEKGGYVSPIPGKIGHAISVPVRVVQGIHSFFYTLRYQQEIAGHAYRLAMDEGREGADFDRRTAELQKSPTEEMVNAASAKALKELYMQPTEYDTFLGHLARATNSNLFAKVMVPFAKVGANITKDAFLEQTPLGMAFDKTVRDNMLGRNGSMARDMQTAKITAGVALMSALSLAAIEGKATGDGPDDPDQRRVWLEDHHPNSIDIGGLWVPYQGLGSLGMLMRFSANMTETAAGLNGDESDKLAVSFLKGITRSVLDDNFMRGIHDAMQAMYQPQEYGDRYLSDFATNWLPFSVGAGQLARKIDPYQRESHTILQSARARIPFASEGLYPRVDIFGMPVKNNGPYDENLSNPILKNMEALQIKVKKPPKDILGVPLTDHQYYDYSVRAGQMFKTMSGIIGTSGFSQMPKMAQLQIIKNNMKISRESAKSYMLAQYPEIAQQANFNKVKDAGEDAYQ